MSVVKVDGGGLEVIIDSRRFDDAMQKAPRIFKKEMKAVLEKEGEKWKARVRARFVPFQRHTNSPQAKLFHRSSKLKRSIKYKVSGRGVNDVQMNLTVGNKNTPYANIQEHGGTIRPRNGKYLTVPMNYALTSKGNVKSRARIRKQGDSYVTDLGSTFLLNRSGGRKYIAVDVNGKVKVLYSLRKEVTIPGPKSTGDKSSLGAFDEAKRISGDRMSALIMDRVRKAIRNKAGG